MGEILSVEGLDEMSSFLLKQASGSKRRKVLQKYGAQLKQSAINRAQFSRGYSTGATRRSITLQTSDSQATVTAGTGYSGFLEVGTRFMSAQPFMGPALDEVAPKMVEELATWEE